MSHWNQNSKLCIKVWVVTHFNSAGLIGQHKWDTCDMWAEYSKTNDWQQVLTETWNWHKMDWAANNDALYIASSVTLLSLVSSALRSLCPLAPHEAIIRREPGAGTWHLRQRLGAWSVSPAHLVSSANQRPGWHQVTNQRASPAHVSVVWRCLTIEMSQCAKLGHRERDSGLQFHVTAASECTERNFGDLGLTFGSSLSIL